MMNIILLLNGNDIRIARHNWMNTQYLNCRLVFFAGRHDGCRLRLVADVYHILSKNHAIYILHGRLKHDAHMKCKNMAYLNSLSMMSP